MACNRDIFTFTFYLQLHFDVAFAGVMNVGVRLLHSVARNFMSVLNLSSGRRRPMEVPRKVSDIFWLPD
jgi:hypothetical protein